MSENKPLVLVDGSSYLFRAYHIPNLQVLSNAKGEPTGAMYGVINMMRRLQQSYPDSVIVVVFDAKGKTFRHEMYNEYKANRPPMPQDLAAQIMPLHNILRAMGFPLIAIQGVEADDVIGTLAKQATEHQQETIISTGDKDMAQLVNEHITLINTMNDTAMDVNGVKEKFGIPPALIIDYLALIGDTVDNIPGVPKVGPKTAVKWLDQFGSLKEIMAHADEFKGKVGENLRNSLGHLPLSYELATIKCDVDLEDDIKSLKMQAPDKKALEKYFTEYDFKTWLREIQKDESVQGEDKAENKNVNKEYETILKEKELDRWIKLLEKADYFAFDTETTSLDYINAEIVGVSFSAEVGKAAYVPVAHDYEGAPKQLLRDKVLNKLKPLLESPKNIKLGQNLKYDMSVLARYGIELQGIGFDTMLESYVLNSVATRHDMDSLAEFYLGEQTIHFEDIAGKGAKQKTFNEIEIEQASPYAAEDADITLRLHETLWGKLETFETLVEVFEKIELPLMPVLSRVERNGVLIDEKALKKQSKEITKKLADLEQKSYELAGEEFNLSSPKQIQAIFFEKLDFPILKKTPKGQPSTNEAVLQELAEDYDFELPKVILEHRGLSKLKSTYTDRLPEDINPSTGRVHTSYHQAVAATGRLSSTSPNLQNIPIRSAEGRRIRQAFIAPSKHKIVAADYSQIELRIMAHLSKDDGLLSAFNAGKDIHQSTAAEIFDVDIGEVSSEQRRSAKAINFGLIYGMSAFGLARQLGIERGKAQQYMEEYFSRYPGVKVYMDDIRKQAKDQGFVETLFGRRLYLPEINSRNAMRRQYAERTAINAPMQGTAADIIKLAMIAVDNWIHKDTPPIKMIMQVHDELVFEVEESQLESCCGHIKAIMESAAVLDVPLIVDVGVGDNWDEAH